MQHIIEGCYVWPLVALSVLVAIVSSLVAISLVTRLNDTHSSYWHATAWSWGFGLSLGCGIWSMHFIAMLAFRLPVTVHYDVFLTLLSLLMATLCCAVSALPLRHGGELKGRQLWQTGALTGCGIAGMHYTGMAAMQIPGQMHYSLLSVMLALVVAIMVATLAFWIANRLRQIDVLARWRIKLLAATVMGMAVASMHYLAMWGTTFTVSDELPLRYSEADLPLVAALAVITVLVESSMLVMGALDQANATARMLQKNQQRYQHMVKKLRWESQAAQILEDMLRISMNTQVLSVLLEEALRNILAFERFGGLHKGSVFVYHAATRQLEMIAAIGMPPALLQSCQHVRIGHCLCGRAALDRQLLFVPCVDERHETRYEGIEEHGHYCLPIHGSNDALLGVLNCYVAVDYQYSNHDRIFLERAASTLALIIERKQLNDTLRRQAHHDPLTGLPNRVLLYEQLSLMLSEEERYPNGGALMFIDLDKFKQINDTLGHETGDVLLKEVARRIRSCVRSSDLVARIGGDEFIVVVSHLQNTTTSATVAEKLLSVLQRDFMLAGEPHRIACSIGIAEFPADGMTPDVLIRKADEAMYAVKYTGRNAFLYYRTQWQQRLSMLDSRIDAEHQSLLRMSDELNNTIAGHPEDRAAVMHVFHALQAETIAHFSHEEAWMFQQGYPKADNHKKKHEEAKVVLDSAGQAFRHSPLPIDSAIGFAVKEAIISHILKEDAHFIGWLQQKHERR